MSLKWKCSVFIAEFRMDKDAHAGGKMVDPPELALLVGAVVPEAGPDLLGALLKVALVGASGE